MGRASAEALADSVPRAFPIRATVERFGLPSGKDFNKLFLECVDASLADLLGPKVRDTAYLVLKRKYALSRSDIPLKPNQFGFCLDQVFGVAGRTIGRTIARRLYSKLGLEFVDKPGYEFHDYIEAAKS